MYLSTIKPKQLRAAVSRFRCSNHILKIETGRHSNINKEHRFCPMCIQKGLYIVETEYHFIADCETYVNLREKYIDQQYCAPNNIVNLFHSSNYNVISNLAIYLHKALQIRKMYDDQ